MTDTDIVTRLAEQADEMSNRMEGAEHSDPALEGKRVYHEFLRCFAALVAEEAARACEEVTRKYGLHSNNLCAAEIRAKFKA